MPEPLVDRPYANLDPAPKLIVHNARIRNNAGRKCKTKTNLVSAYGKPNLGEYAAELRYYEPRKARKQANCVRLDR